MNFYHVTSRQANERGLRQGHGQTIIGFCGAYRLSQFMRSVPVVFGLMFFLAACGAIEANPTQTLLSVQESPVMEVTQPATASADESVEPTVGQEEVVQTVTPIGESPATVGITPTQEQFMSGGIAPAEQTPTPEMSPAEVVSTETVIAHQSPTAEQSQLLASLPILGSPPELHNEVWLNSEPLKLADLRGKVVIVEFWTFG